MSALAQDKTLTLITPRGVQRRMPPGMRMQSFVDQFQKVLFLLNVRLKSENFGTYLGRMWLVLEPALQAYTYYLLIKIILGVTGQDMKFAFFFLGITYWRSHSVIVQSSTSLIAGRGQLFLSSNLPFALLYVEFIAYEALLFLLRAAVLFAFLLYTHTEMYLTWFYMLPIAVVQFMFSFSLAVWLSVFGLFVKDVSRFISYGLFLWWYMSPGLYSIERVPDWARQLYDLNPFALIFPALHQAVFENVSPAITPFLILGGLSLATSYIGLRIAKSVSHRFHAHI